MADREHMPRVRLGEGRLRGESGPGRGQPNRLETPRMERGTEAAPKWRSYYADTRAWMNRGRERWRSMRAAQRSRAEAHPRSWQSRLGIQAGICVALLAVVWGMQAIDTPATQTMVNGIKDAITFEVNVDESIGRLKLVQEYLPNVAAVFMPRTALTEPVEAPVRAYEKEGVYQAADFAAEAGAVVSCAGPGEVLEAGTNSAGIGYVRIRHSDASEGRYENVVELAVKAGDRVERGARLGVVADNGKVLRFTWLVEGVPANPGFTK